MSAVLPDERESTSIRRPAWRQRLVDAETGFRVGIRTDSTLTVCLFAAGLILITAIVVGLNVIEWAILTLALGMALFAELMHQLFKQAAAVYRDRLTTQTLQVLRLGTTAVVAAHLTAAIVCGLLLWQRFAHLWD